MGDRTSVPLAEPAATPAAEVPEHAELREFPNLQKPAPRALPPAVASPPPLPVERRSEAPKPGAAPATPAAPPRETVIAALERKRAAPGPVVQVASYTDPRSADALVARLRRMGFDSYVSNTSPQGEPRFRVRVRPAPGEDPSRVASKLSENGFGVWVTRE
jgi:cell division protein FtsN